MNLQPNEVADDSQDLNQQPMISMERWQHFSQAAPVFSGSVSWPTKQDDHKYNDSDDKFMNKFEHGMT